MLTKLDKNISKISSLDVNVINFLLNKNVNIFLLKKMLIIFFEPKYQYVSLDKKCQ